MSGAFTVGFYSAVFFGMTLNFLQVGAFVWMLTTWIRHGRPAIAAVLTLVGATVAIANLSGLLDLLARAVL